MENKNILTTALVSLILISFFLAPVSAQETEVASGVAITKGPGTTNRDVGIMMYSHGDMNIMFQGGLSEWSVSLGEETYRNSGVLECEGEIVSPGKLGFFRESRGPCKQANVSRTTEYEGGICVTRMDFNYHDRNNGWVQENLYVEFYSFDQSGCNVLPLVES